MKKAAFTVWFNDLVILDVWIRYYKKEFDLYVIIDQPKHLDEIAKRELAKNNSVIKNAFIELELWKTLLHKLYIDNNSELDRVENILLPIRDGLMVVRKK